MLQRLEELKIVLKKTKKTVEITGSCHSTAGIAFLAMTPYMVDLAKMAVVATVVAYGQRGNWLIMSH